MAGNLLVADGLTKELQRQALEEFIKKLKMSASYQPVHKKLKSLHASNVLHRNHKTEAYYRNMMGISLAASALILAGELNFNLQCLY